MSLSETKRTSVARRIHISFIIAATFPLLVLAAVSYYMVFEQLQERALRDAHSLAKDIGMTVYDRLKFVNDELLILNTRDASRDGALPKLDRLDLEERVSGLFRVSNGLEVSGDLSLGVAQNEDFINALAQADKSKPLLFTLDGVARQRLFMLVAGAAEQGNPVWLGAELNTDYLWNTSDVSGRAERVCILDAGEAPVFCNQDGVDRWLRASTELVQQRMRPRPVLHDTDEPMLTAAWSLFLKPHYQLERWTVLVGVPQSQAQASIQNFDRVFAAVALVAAFLAFTLGRRLINSNLKPLARLGVATRELAKGQYTHRVRMDTGDELQQLGDAFDGMAAQIGRQFDELETLARLDRSLQAALSLPEAISAGMQALTGLIGPERCALLCHEKWEAANTLWYLPFAGSDVLQSEYTPNQGLEVAARLGTGAELMADNALLELARADPADLLQIISVVHAQHVQAEILLSDPHPDEVAMVGRVVDTLTTTLSKLVLETRLRYQARHDWLTGLPNRTHLHTLFDQWSEWAREQDGVIGMLLLNLDRFKQINDARGHAEGDRLLIAVAERLRSELPADYVLSRFAGDELIVMIRSLEHYEMLPSLTELSLQISAALDRPFNVAHREIRISASMGAAIFPRHGNSFDTMLQDMDAALRAAKTSRSGGLLMFSTGMRETLMGRMDLEQALKAAVENDEVVMHYQPVVDSYSHKIVSAEALMRWQRPGVGLVMPAGFIEVAEQSGLITELGTQALVQVCRQLQAWRQSGYAIDTVSVNVSGEQLAKPDFERQVEGALRDANLEPQHLTLEVTESALILQFEESAARLKRLREFGVKVMVDDFGTGYASFKYLKLLPIDGLKIDRLFVKDLPDSPRDAAIVASLVSLADASGFKLIAEGIDADAQSKFLHDIGVRNFQGYLFGRGLPAREFEQRLRGEREDQVADAMTG